MPFINNIPTVIPNLKNNTNNIPSAPPKKVPIIPSTIIPKKEEENKEKTVEESPLIKTSTAFVSSEENKEIISETNTEETKETEVKEEEIKTTEKETISEEKNVVVEKPKRTRKKKTEETNTEISDIEIPKSEMSFSEIVTEINSTFIDEEWENFKKEVSEKIQNISITSTMSQATIKTTICELDDLREHIAETYYETKTLYDSLTAKEPEGLIERIKKITYKGNNSEERKMNSLMAVMKYKSNEGKIINLFEVADEAKKRYMFLKRIMDSIIFKKEILITYQSANK